MFAADVCIEVFNYWPLKCTQREMLGFQKFFPVSEILLLVVFGNKYKPVEIPHWSSHVTRVLSLQKASTLVKLRVQIIGRLTQDTHTTTGTGLTNIALWLVFDALGHPDQSLFHQPTTTTTMSPLFAWFTDRLFISDVIFVVCSASKFTPISIVGSHFIIS